jgi:hypothetical protein
MAKSTTTRAKTFKIYTLVNATPSHKTNPKKFTANAFENG